ncbi:hypothetical protein APS56_12535 [Pseudalgibacter alginicilyticus]|uniref:DUF2383 domain-containing protein n=2 Tax=Pseudalgibacter alginicilyticus TaxID=1736674 RepID=A0A0P0CSV0_9FLAO|nr:hypothetical protein APS56_12535 [Pseudalgibacter alginicilyticus]
MNYESVKIYTETQKHLTHDGLKAFFKKRAMARQKFIVDLSLELKKLGGEPQYSQKLSYNFYRTWIRLRDLFAEENENDLLSEISDLKAQDLEKYNELLREINLPLSVCKLLVKQTDDIQSALNTIKRHNLQVA